MEEISEAILLTPLFCLPLLLTIYVTLYVPTSSLSLPLSFGTCCLWSLQAAMWQDEHKQYCVSSKFCWRSNQFQGRKAIYFWSDKNHALLFNLKSNVLVSISLVLGSSQRCCWSLGRRKQCSMLAPLSPSSNPFGPVAKWFLSCELTVFFGMNCALSIFHFKSTHFSRSRFTANEERNFPRGEGLILREGQRGRA